MALRSVSDKLGLNFVLFRRWCLSNGVDLEGIRRAGLIVPSLSSENLKALIKLVRWRIIEGEGLVRRRGIELLEVIDGLVRHVGGRVVTRMADPRPDYRGGSRRNARLVK